MPILSATAVVSKGNDRQQIYVVVVTFYHRWSVDGVYHVLALSQRIGFGEQHLRLSQLPAQLSFEGLVELFMSQLSYGVLIDEDHDSKTWLEEPAPV